MASSRSVYTCARAALALLAALMTATVASAATITVPAGGDLQAALNAARPGDTILLAPGATYVGNFELPVHGGTTYVTLRTGGDPALLPGDGVRVTPQDAPSLAKLQSPNSAPALDTKAGAAYWRVTLVEFPANKNGSGDIVALGDATATQNALTLVPHHLILDRVYIHGDPVFGQKRGIALNSAETTIINSHVSDIRSISQDSQAIGGWNGPGPFRIENNYLEAAGEVFILGGDDPKIAGLVPSNLTFRGNLVTRPASWKSPLLVTPGGVTSSAGTGGTLAAGTYGYRVVARKPVGINMATSARSSEVQATVVAGGKVTVRWTAVSGATEYRVYGRTAGGQTMYWRTTTTSFTDTGAAGTAGTAPTAASMWVVKNLFELKNARNVQIDSNLFENHWAQAQAGPAILFTVRNQYGGCTWCVVENVTFEYNVVRNIAAGFHILGIDTNYPSQQTNNIRIRHNEVSGLDKTKWGGTGYFLLMVNQPRDIQVDHNTIIAPSSNGIISMGGLPIDDFVYTNNLARHNTYGIIGSNYGSGLPTINYYLPNSVTRRNVFAGGKASLYPADNYFPTTTEFEAMFVDYARGDYRLKAYGSWAQAGTDGKDLGADYSRLLGPVQPPTANPPQVGTAVLPAATAFQAYSATLQAAGGVSPYRWSVIAGALPAGLTLSTAGQISGTPSIAGDFAFTVQVTDANNAAAQQPLSIHVEDTIQPVQIATTALPGATATLAYSARFSATGGLGSYVWSLSGGALPGGLTLSSTGNLTGIPAAMGTYTFTVKAQDASAAQRYATRQFTLLVAKAPNKAPTVSVSAPSTVVQVGAPATFTATAADSDGSISRVDFFVNGAHVGTTTTAPFSVKWIARDGGPHSVTAVATDNENATATSAPDMMAVTAEIVIYASDVKTMAGNFQLVADSTAANGKSLWNANKGAAKLAASAAPASYAEFTFYAEAGRAYHVWIRGKAEGNSWANDSVYMQFSGAVDAVGTAAYRIGTTSAMWYSVEEESNAGVSGWGWQDNGFGLGVMGAHFYFASTGLQTIRLQQREDGLSVDQIVMSPVKYLLASPGAGKNDGTIVAR